LQRQKRRVGRIESRTKSREIAVQETRQAKRQAGIFLCPTKCPTTNRYCRTEFLTEAKHNKHLRAGKHNFPIGMGSNTATVLKASRPGGIVAAGNRPNTLSSNFFVTIEEAPVGTLGMNDAICFGKFNRKVLTYLEKYQKPFRLVQVLRELYRIGQDGSVPKLKAEEIHARVKEMRDSDGSLMFCYSKRGSWPREQFCELCEHSPCDCNGMMLTVEKIKEWMNSETQKNKKAAKNKD
jgi:cyclophilin family peptidyl-prolyl cis-trans isomerase